MRRMLRHLRRLQVQAALVVLCGLTAEVADELGVPALRDSYLVLAGCWAALSVLDLPYP